MNPTLLDLIKILAGCYHDADEAKMVLIRAGLQPATINFAKPPKIFWMQIVENAEKHAKVPDLASAVIEEYPNLAPAIDNILQRLQRPPDLLPPRNVPPVEGDEWRGSVKGMGGLEKVLGDQPTFLPVNFLEVGLARSRAVGLVRSPLGVGSGFLIGGNLLITCNHVISSKEDASSTKLWFNFQSNAGGAQAQVAEFALAPELTFATSPLHGGHDWTAVRVRDNAAGSPNAQFGQLELVEVKIKTNDYVNIIQHPGGLPKQVALYHNVVVFSDDTDYRVQYLTDTLPGSSGSPVFDSEWRVVALHHAGGDLTDPKSGRLLFRNEGIHVNTLISGLRKAHLLPA